MKTHVKNQENWTVAGAKAKLSEVIERAQTEPQTITRNGKPSAWLCPQRNGSERPSRKGTLAEFLMALHCAAPIWILNACPTHHAILIYEGSTRHKRAFPSPDVPNPICMSCNGCMNSMRIGPS